MAEDDLHEQCTDSEIELEEWTVDAMRAALRELYIPAGGAGEDDEFTGEVEWVIYETADGEYSDETPLSDAWELWKTKKTITEETMCWAEGFDDWVPWAKAKHELFNREQLGEEEEVVEEGEPGKLAIPQGFQETDESRARRAQLMALRPYQVKAECKKKRLANEGKKEELIEALIIFEFGGGAQAAKEMAAAAAAKMEEAKKKKEAEKEAQRQKDEGAWYIFGASVVAVE